MSADDLAPKESARVRKRDGKRSARGKALMRTGLAKTFQTIIEIQQRRAKEARERQSTTRPTKSD